MLSRRAKWSFVLFAVISNLGGGPMAWARLSPSGGHCHTQPTPSTNGAAPHCHEHRASTPDHLQPNHSLPCCDGGSCACTAPPSSAADSPAAIAEVRHDTTRTLL